MIEYERTSWWKICFAIRGTVLPHVLDRVGLLTAFALVLYLVEVLVLEPLKYPLPELDPLGHTVLGLALSLLVSSRTNVAITRFWEARSHWGMMVNTCRSLVRMGSVYAGPADDLARLVAAYVVLVKEQLRRNRETGLIRSLVPGRVLEQLEKANNRASVLAGYLSEWVAHRQDEGRLNPMVAQRMESLIVTLLDSQGGCEKIRKTPLPFVYAALIKQALLLYLASLPFALIPKMGFVAPLVVAGTSLVLLGIEEAGVEIEDPFGLDANHLPLDRICADIARDAIDLAEQKYH